MARCGGLRSRPRAFVSGKRWPAPTSTMPKRVNGHEVVLDREVEARAPSAGAAPCARACPRPRPILGWAVASWRGDRARRRAHGRRARALRDGSLATTRRRFRPDPWPRRSTRPERSMPRSESRENLICRDARARHVLPNRVGEEAVKARTFGGIELVDVIGGDELDLRTLGEGARFIEDKPAALHAGAQCVRHSGSLARRRAHRASPAHELDAMREGNRRLHGR